MANEQSSYYSEGMGEKLRPFESPARPAYEPPAVEASLVDFVRYTIGRWRTVFVALLIGGLIALLLAWNLLANANRSTYSYFVNFTFANVIEGAYPDGTRFALGDITAPVILDTVYEANSLADRGIAPEEFDRAFQVTAYPQNREAIVAKYQVLFDERKSTLADLQENQRSMNDEIARDARSSARIIFEDPTGGNLPSEFVAKIVADVVDTWAKQAIDVRGVLAGNISAPSPILFSPDQLQGLEPLNALRALRNRVVQLNAYLDTVAERPGGPEYIDPESGKNLQVLRTETDNAMLRVREVVSTWSRELVGTASAPVVTIPLFSSGALVDVRASSLDYLVATDAMDENITLLQQNLDRISEQTDGATATDPETGLNATDLRQLVTAIRTYDFTRLRATIVRRGLSEDPENLRGYYSSILSADRAQMQALRDKGQTISSAINQQVAGSSPNGRNDSGGTTMIPQFDDSFLDRLIDLSGREASNEYIRTLTEREIEFRQSEIDIETRVRRTEEYLNFLSTLEAELAANPATAGEIDELKSRIVADLDRLSTTLKTYADATSRIAQRISIARNLFAIIEPGDSPLVGFEYYLRDSKLTTSSLETELSALGQIAIVAGRIGTSIDETTYGESERLFRPLSGVERLGSGIVNLRNLVMLAMPVVLAGFIAFILILTGYFRRTVLQG